MGFIIIFIPPSKDLSQPAYSYTTGGDKSPIIANNSESVSVDYSTKLQGTALLNTYDKEEIAANKKVQIRYFASKDEEYTFASNTVYAEVNGNGSQDALIEDVIACGGNCCANAYFFVAYRGDGHFERSPAFGYSWDTPKIKQWKGLNSVVVLSHNEGMNQQNAEESFARYVLDSGQAVKVEESTRNELVAIVELRSKEFDFDRKDQILVVKYDINGDGIEDELGGRLWQRWGRILWYVKLSNEETYESSTGCKRIGILQSSTNGLHDIVCDQDDIWQWSDGKYVDQHT